MKAIVYENCGPPEVLHLEEVEIPVPKGRKVLIRIYAASVNSGDVRLCQADPFAANDLIADIGFTKICWTKGALKAGQFPKIQHEPFRSLAIKLTCKPKNRWSSILATRYLISICLEVILASSLLASLMSRIPS